MNDNIMSAANLMENLFRNISLEDANKAVTVVNAWKEIVSRIKSSAMVDEKRNDNLGNNIADHSRVVDLKNGVLLVEADHPGWISLLQFYKNFILKGFEMKYGGFKIHNIVFKLSGTRGELYETVEEKEKMGRRIVEKQIEEEDKLPKPAESEFLAKREKKELPPEIMSIFADIEKDFDGRK